MPQEVKASSTQLGASHRCNISKRIPHEALASYSFHSTDPQFFKLTHSTSQQGLLVQILFPTIRGLEGYLHKLPTTVPNSLIRILQWGHWPSGLPTQIPVLNHPPKSELLSHNCS